MTEIEKAINEALTSIIDEIAKWQKKKEPMQDDVLRMARDRGFKEGLRLSGALVRARLISDDIEEEADDE
jgi:hypothetical protein